MSIESKLKIVDAIIKLDGPSVESYTIAASERCYEEVKEFIEKDVKTEKEIIVVRNRPDIEVDLLIIANQKIEYKKPF